MFKSIRCLLVLIVMAPAMALAQPRAQAPCPSTTLDLSELASLPEVSSLAELSDLKHLVLLGQEMAQTGHPEDAAMYDAEKQKTFDKTYKVSKSDVLNIENKFGKVHVNTWNRNEIKVNVVMIARAGTDSKAQEILDKINVVESRSGNTIALKTNMASMNVSGNSNRSFEINYTISMPEENAIAVKNSFGDVYLAALKGKADISVKYGSLKADRLANTGNIVRLAYGSGSCGYVNGGNVDVAYSNLNVEGTNGLKGQSKFSDFKIGSLGEELNMDVKYGSFKIDNVSKNIRQISLQSGFTPISLNFEDNTAFNFDVSVKFGNFNVDKSLVNITHLEKGYTSSEYKGKFGGESPKGWINITSTYGDVKFTK
ncbi:MAG: hypothetical protein LPK14_06010 [Hymenobacteraceae bacterium]|nr:hypothetical protein [Hymenobacteraceae bacterium]